MGFLILPIFFFPVWVFLFKRCLSGQNRFDLGNLIHCQLTSNLITYSDIEKQRNIWTLGENTFPPPFPGSASHPTALLPPSYSLFLWLWLQVSVGGPIGGTGGWGQDVLFSFCCYLVSQVGYQVPCWERANVLLLCFTFIRYQSTHTSVSWNEKYRFYLCHLQILLYSRLVCIVIFISCFNFTF